MVLGFEQTRRSPSLYRGWGSLRRLSRPSRHPRKLMSTHTRTQKGLQVQNFLAIST
jgi:hypothetical protein